MKKFLWFSLLTAAIAVCFQLISLQTHAAMNFTVTPLPAEKQLDKTKNYFDLGMHPNEKTVVKVAVKNNQDYPITVQLRANTARTNDNGTIDYTIADPKKADKSLIIDLSKHISVPREIKLDAGQKRVLSIPIQLPDKAYKGTLLAGLHLIEKEKETKQVKKQIAIENRYAYVIGIRITDPDNKQEPKPSLHLHQIFPSQVNHHNVLKANLQNSKAVLIDKLQVQAKVTKKGSKKVLHQNQKAYMRMAPNSNFNFGVSWENQAFRAGEYTLHLQATDGDKVWKWTRDFEIKQKEAKAMNQQAAELERNYLPLIIIGSSILILALLILAYWLGKRQNKKTDQ